jgi:hypothetical protein
MKSIKITIPATYFTADCSRLYESDGQVQAMDRIWD